MYLDGTLDESFSCDSEYLFIGIHSAAPGIHCEVDPVLEILLHRFRLLRVVHHQGVNRESGHYFTSDVVNNLVISDDSVRAKRFNSKDAYIALYQNCALAQTAESVNLTTTAASTVEASSSGAEVNISNERKKHAVGTSSNPQCNMIQPPHSSGSATQRGSLCIPQGMHGSSASGSRIVHESESDEKQIRQRAMAKQRQQKSRIKAGLVKAGVSEDLIRQVLEKKIEGCQMENLKTKLPKSFASAVHKWCNDSGPNQANRKIAFN